MSLSVGHIAYANCLPFFHFLRESGFNGTIIDGVPSELNRMLASGEVDICPSSSIEYAKHPSDYLILPGQSISSIGSVESVLLFSSRPLSELNGVPIAITGESATSVALLQILLKEFIRLDEVICRVPDVSVEDAIARGEPALLIGDRALKMGGARLHEKALDLGALWHHFTGLPFVFALWTVRKDVAQRCSPDVAHFVEQLNVSRARAFRELNVVVNSCNEVSWMGTERLKKYLQSVSYDLDAQHLEGLACFYALLEKYGYIESVPELEFVLND